MNLLLSQVTAVTPYGTRICDIAIENGRIRSLDGVPEGFVPEYVLDGSDKICIPGLVNCHTHAYMSLFRNYADDLAFSDWLFGKILPKEDLLTPEDAYWGTMLSCMEMLKRGCTTFCDMHMFPNVTPRVAKEIGIRAVVTRGLTGPDGGERRIREALTEYETWCGEETLSFMLAPHAIYTCSEEYLKQIVRLSEQTNLTIHIHLSESETEVRNCYEEHGCSPVEYLERIGMLSRKTLAAHCVHLSEHDTELLAQYGVSIAHNPKSNLKLANGSAPICRLQKHGVNLCLGTDGAGSNNALNLFSEMNYACLLPKGTERDGSVVSASEVFSMATENGAKALSLENVGKIEVGAKADLVLLDRNSVAFCPWNDPVRAICYAANGSEVDTVLVGGEIVLEHGVCTRIDEKEVYARVNDITKDWN